MPQCAGALFSASSVRGMPAGPAPASSVVLLQAWVFFAVPPPQFPSTQENTCSTGNAGSMSRPTKEAGWSSMSKSKLPAAEALQPPRAVGDGNTQCTVKHPGATRAAPRHTGLYYRMCMFPRMCQNAATAMQALLGCELSGLQTHAHATHASERPCSMLSTPPPGQLLAATILPRTPHLANYYNPYNVSPILSPHPSYKCTAPSAPSTHKPFLQPHSLDNMPIPGRTIQA